MHFLGAPPLCTIILCATRCFVASNVYNTVVASRACPVSFPAQSTLPRSCPLLTGFRLHPQSCSRPFSSTRTEGCLVASLFRGLFCIASQRRPACELCPCFLLPVQCRREIKEKSIASPVAKRGLPSAPLRLLHPFVFILGE